MWSENITWYHTATTPFPQSPNSSSSASLTTRAGSTGSLCPSVSSSSWPWGPTPPSWSPSGWRPLCMSPCTTYSASFPCWTLYSVSPSSPRYWPSSGLTSGPSASQPAFLNVLWEWSIVSGALSGFCIIFIFWRKLVYRYFFSCTANDLEHILWMFDFLKPYQWFKYKLFMMTTTLLL